MVVRTAALPLVPILVILILSTPQSTANATTPIIITGGDLAHTSHRTPSSGEQAGTPSHVRASLPIRLVSPEGNSTDPPVVQYDEQLGITFTQSLTAIVYNVTVVAQSDSNGYGPGYLLNGLSNTGYWYQVGITYNWPYTTLIGTGGYCSGFIFAYEVFNPNGTSISPTGVSPSCASGFSGPVNNGDKVLLSLYFSGGNVVMYSHDWNTRASASANYSAEGAASFAGLSSPSNKQGFFTGLMTEWWHSTPYYGNQLKVDYYDSSASISSALMWIDEYNPITNQIQFFSASPSPVSLQPTQLQSFSSHAATEFASGKEFITGYLGNAMSISLLPDNQSTPLSPSNYFTLSYSLNGEAQTLVHTGGRLVLFADQGSNIRLGGLSSGSSSNEEWVLASSSAGVSIPSSTNITIYYFDLLAQSPSYSIIGGGSPGPLRLNYSTAPPIASTSDSPSSSSILLQQIPQTIWCRSGSTASVAATSAGSTAERWAPSGSTSLVISAPNQLASITYYHQFLATFSYGVLGGGSGFSAPQVSYYQLGSQGTIATGTQVWVDASSQYSFPNLLPGSGMAERWYASPAPGTISSSSSVNQNYYHQYLLTLVFSLVGGGSNLSYGISSTFQGQPLTQTLSTGGPLWLDAGASYAITNTLAGSTSTERWETSAQTYGTITSSSTINLAYYHQFLTSLSYSVIGGGSGYSPPSFSYLSLGATSVYVSSTTAPVWMDAGSTLQATNPLSGSTAAERWATIGTTVSSAGQVSLTYYHQYSVRIGIEASAAATFDPGLNLTIPGTQFGSTNTVCTIIPARSNSSASCSGWVDASNPFTWPSDIDNAPSNVRWRTNDSVIPQTVVASSSFIRTYYRQVQESFSYSVNGGTGYRAPLLSYDYLGVPEVYTLTTGVTPLWIDSVHSVSVTRPLAGSNSTVRWDAKTGSVSPAPGARFNPLFYHQILQTLSYNVTGGGTGYAPPIVSGLQYGEAYSQGLTNNLSGFWFDAGKPVSFGSSLIGSTSTERWNTETANLTAASHLPVTVIYYHQYSKPLSYSVMGGGTPSAPKLQSSSHGKPILLALALAPSAAWLDAGAYYNVTQVLPPSTSAERWFIPQASGLVADPSAISPSYYHQYYVRIEPNLPGAGSFSPQSGWSDAGSSLSISATANKGWKFNGWNGSGTGSFTGSTETVPVSVVGPISEIAVFYPGVTISAGAGGFVSFSYGATSGSVQSGLSQTIVVPPSTNISLVASPSSFFYSFSNWGNTLPSTQDHLTVNVKAPTTLSASYGYNYLAIVGIVTVAVAIPIIMYRLFLRRRR